MNTAWTFLAIMVVYPFLDPETAIEFLQLAINYQAGPAVGARGLPFQGPICHGEVAWGGLLWVSPRETDSSRASLAGSGGLTRGLTRGL